MTSLRFQHALVAFALVFNSALAHARMTCPQISGLMDLVKLGHVVTMDPKLKDKLLTDQAFARTLRDDFLTALDPGKQFLLESEFNALDTLTVDQVKASIFGRGDCRLFERPHEAYLAAVNRSLRLIPARDGDDAPLCAEITARLATPEDTAEPTRPRTEAELIERSKQILTTMTRAFEQEYRSAPEFVRREAYDIARETFDQQRLEPFTKSRLPQFLVSLVLSHVDSHSTYFDPRAFKVANEMFEDTVGIGAVMGVAAGGLFVREIVAGGPAARGGHLRAWDKIVAVDGQRLKTNDLNDSVSKIRGPDQTQVRLSVVRGPEAQPVEVVITRGRITTAQRTLSTETLSTPSGPLGYLRITMFDARMAAGVGLALNEFKRGGVRGLVLDLRGNPGGMINEAVDLIQHFEGRAPANAIYLLDSTSRGVVRFPLKPERVMFGQPVVVLVDRASASASELVSGALQTYGRAVVIGNSPTFGKGSVQNMVSVALHAVLHPSVLPGYLTQRLPSGGLALTTGYYFLPDGRSIQNVGVSPDITLFPKRAYDDRVSEAKSSPHSLPQPTPLPPEVLAQKDDVSVFGEYRRHLAPTVEFLKADFERNRERLEAESPQDPEKRAAIHILERWISQPVH